MPKKGYSDREGIIYEYGTSFDFKFNNVNGYTQYNFDNAFRYL